ncbi:MAG: EamA family transporter [Candidatus Pacearchaeota archaeon]
MEWYIIAIGSALFSAFAAILEKKILFKEKALSFSVLLAIFNFIIAIPFFFFISFQEVTISSLLVLFFKEILDAAAFLCIMITLKNMEISKALPLLVITPALVAIFSFIFLQEALTTIQISGMILILIGTYVLQTEKNQNLLNPWKAFFKNKSYYYILTALILFTITSVLDKSLLKNFKLPVNAFIGFQHLFLAIIFLGIILFSGKSKQLKHTFKFSWQLIFLLGLITITYRYLQISAVKDAPVALVLSLKRTSVFFATLIGGTLFKDKNLLIRTIATAIMTLGAILIII